MQQLKDFTSQMRPLGRRSQLWPLVAEILELERLDYAYWQIVLFLQMGGVDASVDAVKEFIEIAKRPKMMRA